MSRWTLITLIAIGGCGAPADGDAGVDAGPTESDAAPPAPDPDAGPEDAGPEDAGPEDAGRTIPDAGIDELDVSFTAPPAHVTHVRGTLSLQVFVQGGTADSVELWKDGSVLVALPPPYTYSWNTDAETEGAHVMEARAIVDGEVAGRATRQLTVDRTPPTIVERAPAPDSASASLRDPWAVVFSEPVADASLAGAFSLTVGGAALATAHGQPTPGRVEVRPTAPPASLPAPATLTVGGTVTDLAGNALGADDTWSFTIPLWVAGPPLGVADTIVLDATIASDGTVWVLYRVLLGGPFEELRAARWDGAAWYEVPTPLYAGSGDASLGRIRTRASGRAVVAWSESDGGAYATRLAEQYGTGWVNYSPARRADEYVSQLDLEIEADGSAVLARWIAPDYLVDRYTGAWSAVGGSLSYPELYSSRGAVDLLVADDGLRLAYIGENDCKVVRETSGGWTAPDDIYRVSSDDDRCVDVRLVESGDADGEVFGFVRIYDYSYYGSDYDTYVRVESTPVWGAAAAGYPNYWRGAAASTAGWYALGDETVYDQSGTALEGAVDGLTVLVRDDRPIVVTSAPSVLELNALP